VPIRRITWTSGRHEPLALSMSHIGVMLRITRAAVLAVMAAGCTSSHHQTAPSPPTPGAQRLGTVSGHILQVGGPLGGPYDSGGVVFVYQGDRYVGHVSVPRGRSFMLTLPAGTYRLTGGNRSSPHCAPAVTVVVSAARPMQTQLRCEIR
jgi:hypothetical protein